MSCSRSMLWETPSPNHLWPFHNFFSMKLLLSLVLLGPNAYTSITCFSLPSTCSLTIRYRDEKEILKLNMRYHCHKIHGPKGLLTMLLHRKLNKNHHSSEFQPPILVFGPAFSIDQLECTYLCAFSQVPASQPVSKPYQRMQK